MAEVPLPSVSASLKVMKDRKGTTVENKTLKILIKKEGMTTVTTKIAITIKATTTKAIMMTVTVEDTATVAIMVATMVAIMEGVEGLAEVGAEVAL